MEWSDESRLRALRLGLDDVESLKTYTTSSYFCLGREVEADFALWNPGVQNGVRATLRAVIEKSQFFKVWGFDKYKHCSLEVAEKDGLNLDGYNNKINGRVKKDDCVLTCLGWGSWGSVKHAIK